MPEIPEMPCPALVGRKEAARVLGVKPENIFRDIPGIPRPLQDRKIKGFNVSTGPLWPRAEIEELVKLERKRKAQEARDAQRLARERERRKRSIRKTRALAPR